MSVSLRKFDLACKNEGLDLIQLEKAKERQDEGTELPMVTKEEGPNGQVKLTALKVDLSNYRPLDENCSLERRAFELFKDHIHFAIATGVLSPFTLSIDEYKKIHFENSTQKVKTFDLHQDSREKRSMSIVPMANPKEGVVFTRTITRFCEGCKKEDSKKEKSFIFRYPTLKGNEV